MEDRIKKKRKIASYLIYAYFICAIIYFTISKFILKADSTEYNILEKLVLISGPIAQSINTAREKLYYATIFWIVFSLVGIFGLFYLL